MSMTSPPRPILIRGFTLIEIVITIVILGAVAGILVPFFNAIVHSPDPVIRERAISLGQAMMDEIMAKKWDKNTSMGGGPICTGESTSQTTRTSLIDDCSNPATGASTIGPDGQTDRTLYDDVDDYNGLDETNTFTDQNGATTTLTGYRRQVSVRYIASGPLTPTAPYSIDQNTEAVTTGTTDTKRVVVTITSPLGEVFTFVAVACNI